MKRTTCFLSKAVNWCAAKCRALLGAFGFMLPAVPATAPVRWRSFRRVALLLVFLFVLLAPMFFRVRPDPGGLFFACPVRIRSYCYATTFGQASFTYTGTYIWVDDGTAGWRLKLLTSGTFTPYKDVEIDLFLVGGGGSGVTNTSGSSGRGAGGGGYTGTWTNITLISGVGYPVVIGAGGTSGNAGNASSFNSVYFANGGGVGIVYQGGSGGSGGGAGSNNASYNGGYGGSDGSGGQSVNGNAGGAGQGSTKREFGETTGDLYGGGGGGGACLSGGTYGAGGAGGGGHGGAANGSGQNGTANTGGGGGGAGGRTAGTTYSGTGGSGICVIRNKR